MNAEKQNKLNGRLIKAIENNDKHEFKAALKEGADIDFGGGRPLHTAIGNNNTKMLTRILEAGATVSDATWGAWHINFERKISAGNLQPDVEHVRRFAKYARMLLATGEKFPEYEESSYLKELFNQAAHWRATWNKYSQSHNVAAETDLEEQEANNGIHKALEECATELDKIAYYIKDVRDKRLPVPAKEELAKERIELDLEKRKRSILKRQAAADSIDTDEEKPKHLGKVEDKERGAAMRV